VRASKASKGKITTVDLLPLTGGMNTASQEGGLALHRASSLGGGTPQTELRLLENFYFGNATSVKKTFGFELFKDLGAGKVTGIIRFKKSGINDLLIMKGGSLYKDSSVTALASGFHATNTTDFTVANDKCVICDQVTAPKTWDGTTVATLGDGCPIGALQTVYYQNRLWVFSTDYDTSRVFYSNPLDITAGYSTQFVACGLNDGQKIVAMQEFFIPGQLKPVLLVSKEKSIGIITGSGATDDPYYFVKINNDVGVSSSRSFVQFGQDMAYLTNRGVSTYSTNITNGNLQNTYISMKVQPSFIDNPALAYKDAMTWYDYRNNRLGFAVAENQSAHCNAIWYFDLMYQAWYREKWGTSQKLTAVFVDDDGILLHGDENGKVWRHSEQAQSFGGQPIISRVITDSFSAETMLNARVMEAFLFIKSSGIDNTLSVQHRFDWNAREGQIINIAIPTSDAAIYGVAHYNMDRYSTLPILQRRWYPKGWFRTISMDLTHTSSSSDIEIYGLKLIIEQGDLK
jgi:hypothetical protein